MRAGREVLADGALARLDAGDREGALVLLLADQDDWWRGPTAEPDALRELVRGQHSLSLREAMALLAWGPVADYFAHRWSDPTFLAGLALVEAHWQAPRSAFELACGIGHHLRALADQGVAVTGADVVFAKLWVARHWVVPSATLICVDAAQEWNLSGRFDLVACHDAFYFLEPKAGIGARLKGLLAPGGVLAIGHVHNREFPNLSAGIGMSAAELGEVFPGGIVYDDAELTRALAEGRAPAPSAQNELADVEAFAIAAGPGLRPPRAVSGGLALPPQGAALARNPLYGGDGIVNWPSPRYREEYGQRATYPMASNAPLTARHDAAHEVQARRRELVHLPERW